MPTLIILGICVAFNIFWLIVFPVPYKESLSFKDKKGGLLIYSYFLGMILLAIASFR